MPALERILALRFPSDLETTTGSEARMPKNFRSTKIFFSRLASASSTHVVSGNHPKLRDLDDPVLLHRLFRLHDLWSLRLALHVVQRLELR